MWQHSHWPSSWFANYPKSDNGLSLYAKECNTVEGNTTFYSLPNEDAVARWCESVPEGFRFTFKFHQNITHLNQLQYCDEEVAQQLTLLRPLKEKLGVMMLQLPASFGPEKLSVLDTFLAALPQEINVAVEVRHLAFFAKGDEEKALNQLLIRHGANRIIMDTRALFTGSLDAGGTVRRAMFEEVRQKKPRVPVNVIATGNTPIVRFVGNDVDEDNRRCLLPWVKKVCQWQEEGKDVYFFCHRPDNKDAPWLAQQLIDIYNDYSSHYKLNNLALRYQPAQNALF
ncbi:DUF72 domain-containing protein [Alteromonas gracilis]|uniref:DUF72 domain-containing protein n=1 Tax=Alteromonas gracilis TaxID=1479524 RepID=A0ABX5CP08_9ALTE|nr:DUF72 domain-containing protein [Alteromonas gracilis]PRO68186.1 hypothetical protein C6Y39_14150 [Alteromonas gracilis]